MNAGNKLFYWKRWSTSIAGYLFISPWLLGFFLLTAWPMIQSFYYSFTDYVLLDSPRWLGFGNYTKMFTDDPKFIGSLKVTLLFVSFSVPLKLAFALLVAMLLNRNLKGMSVYRTIIYFPSLIGASVAVSILWSNIFGMDGLLNQLLGFLSIEGKSWIGNPDTALGTLVLLVVWQFGSSMVIFLAGLKQIPVELYEAASMDGARAISRFFRITLPMLSPVILFNLVLQTIGSFQMFTQAYIVTKGGPIDSTYMFALYLYEKAFARLEMGYASAMAWVFLLLMGAVTALVFASSERWVFYESEGGK
ncbi:sugar ABC transporter permease [Paenibacillus sp. KQZ6P-2]|uniref:Sugar ABC transporter permease n=1 Tax=Paenibacillus mangrovi TaxID=2931978 RepID=A0A9X2B3H5_9BACL|nr:sugar ABC transporter permease [Paenibacillus mangrovi]MCJ8013426.1 sugar ABC transporter permease [Paenibacillus mangrovi]